MNIRNIFIAINRMFFMGMAFIDLSNMWFIEPIFRARARAVTY